MNIHLQPGDYYVTTREEQITTLLGSCVAIALYDPVAKVAGLNHYLLAESYSAEEVSTRYGSCAIPALIEELFKRGANLKRLQAKAYGGANVFAEIQSNLKIGERNAEFALRSLAELGIPVVEKNLGGNIGRLIVFSTSDFRVEHRFIGQNAAKAA